MQTRLQQIGFAAACALALSGSAWGEPLALHPENPHYFIYHGNPAVIITSGEHYGAVLNLDFNYEKYLEELAARKLNGTRTFSGAYVEPSGAFNIAHNSMAPGPNKFICPWARADEPGYANGGNKFDLTKWDPAYFKRLRDFVGKAEERGIIVEMNLFCPFYDESQWRLSPQNSINNVNGIGAIARTNAYTLDKNGGLLAVQEAMVKKIVTELNGFDNLYYEICNEPYFGGVTLDWQHHIADTIVATEKALPKKHLISRNVANGQAKVEHPYPAVSILNFHYATPPDTVAMNYSLRRVIGDNETGFRGTNNLPYRSEAWAFLLAGGGLFNNLDYSFTAGHEDGSFVYPDKQPGGGNAVFRAQLTALRDFLYGFDFVHMKPDGQLIQAGLPAGAHAYSLVKPAEAYAIYISPAKQTGKTHWTAKAKIADGEYNGEWLDPVSGRISKHEVLRSENGVAEISSPEYSEDVALSLKKKS